MKKKAVQYLLFLTILLLIANFIIDFTGKKKEYHFENDLSSLEIENKFLETLDECGIEMKWIKVKPNKDSGKDSVDNIINVKIPEDLPLPVLVKYMQGKVDYPFALVKAEEKKKNREITLKVFSNGIQKLEANIARDGGLKRAGSRFAFIINGFESLSKAKQTELLKTPFPFAVELVPSQKETALIDSLKKFKKEHVVLLNDDISGDKFLLKDSFSKEKLRAAVKNILTAYKYYPLYLIDESSDLYSQSKWSFIESEFRANKIRLDKRSDYMVIGGDKEEELLASLDSFIEASGTAGKTGIIDAEDYTALLLKIDKLFRKGNKILYPTENL